MNFFDVVFQVLIMLCYIGALVALELLFICIRFWRLNDATVPTVITNALQRIVLRPQPRPTFECLLVEPVLPHVQTILVNRLLVLKQWLIGSLNFESIRLTIQRSQNHLEIDTPRYSILP